MNEYTNKFQEVLDGDPELVVMWLNFGWLNKIEIVVINSLLAMAED